MKILFRVLTLALIAALIFPLVLAECSIATPDNLVQNPCIEDAGAGGNPAVWSIYTDDQAPPATLWELTWENGYTGNSTRVLKTFSRTTVTGWPYRFGWGQSVAGIESGAWYEFSADMAIKDLEPFLNDDNSLSGKATRLGIAIEFMYPANGVVYGMGYGEESSGFLSYGPVLSDWNQTSWIHATVTNRTDDWRRFSQFVQAPAGTTRALLRTVNMPRGAAYFDNISLRKVSADSVPYKSDLKKQGTLNLFQYQGQNFFPISAYGYPKNAAGDLSIDEMKNLGFNTVYFFHRSYLNPADFQQYLQTEHPELAVFGNAGTRFYYNTDPYDNTLYHWIDQVRSNFYPNYIGAAGIRTNIDAWAENSQLLFWDNIDQDETDSWSYSNNGSYLPELTAAKAFSDYAHARNIKVSTNLGGGPYTGNMMDMATYYRLLDIVSFTNNTHRAYPKFYDNSNDIVILPDLPDAGRRIRRAIETAAAAGHPIKAIAFGTGNYQWTSWDGISCCNGRDQHRKVPFNLQRFQVFNDIINGASGATFFGAGNGVQLEDPNYGIYFTYSWNQIKAIVRELANLRPILEEPQFFNEWTVSDSRINAMLKKHDEKIYLLAASTAYEDLSNIQFTLTGNYSVTKVTALNDITNGDFENPQNRLLCGATSPACQNNSFTDNFIGENASSPQGFNAPGYAVHIYKIELAGEPPAAICGNNTIEGTEQCDTTDLNGQTCLTKDFNGGILTCNSNCTFNTGACTTITYQCSDGIDNDNDNKIDYPADPDCSSPNDNNETGTTLPCIENWTCTEWSACENGFQTRTCTDTNHCATTTTSPQTSQTCSTDNNQNSNPDNNPNPAIDQNQAKPGDNQFALDATKTALIAFAILVLLGSTITAIKTMTDV
ncbi:MAG: hypothetical protein V1777_03475 [Candidatus Micrarchaeota archaeon]